MSVIDRLFKDMGLSNETFDKLFTAAPPPPQEVKVDYNQVRSAVLKEVIRRKTSYVRSEGKTYKVTAVEVEIV